MSAATPATTRTVRGIPVIAAVGAALAGVAAGVSLLSLAMPEGVADSGALVGAAVPAVRVLTDLAAVGTVGLSLLPILIGPDAGQRRAGPVLRTARRAAVGTALVWATSAIVAVLLQTAEHHAITGAITIDDVRIYAEQIPAGKAMLIMAGFALVHAALGVLAIRKGDRVPPELRAGVALFGILPLPVVGHAATWLEHEYSMISMELHVLSAAAWAGGLAALVVLLAGQRALLATALPRFSLLATVCIAVSAVTGLLNGIVEIQSHPGVSLLAGLFTTPYGLLVCAKVSCIAVIGALGARMRWWILPAVEAQRPTAFARWAALELAVMGVAFGFGVVLTRSPVV